MPRNKIQFSIKDVPKLMVYVNGQEVRFYTINPRNNLEINEALREQLIAPKYRLSSTAIKKIRDGHVADLANSLKMSKRTLNAMLDKNPENGPLTTLSALAVLYTYTQMRYNDMAILSFTIKTTTAQEIRNT